MSSIAELCLQEVLARLQAAPPIAAGKVRRGHRTGPTRDMGTVVDVVDGQDTPMDDSDCSRKREKEFAVVLNGRKDWGVSFLDDLMVDVNARLDPSVTAYPGNAILKQGALIFDEEIADLDMCRVEMRFKLSYRTTGWPLDA